MVAIPGSTPPPIPRKPNLDLEVMLTTRLEADRLRLPPYPAIALKLQKLASSGRYSSRDLCATVNADAALVAAVLRRANAADGGRAAAITSLEAAVTRIGIEDLLRLAIAQSVGVTASGSGPLASLRRDSWRCSLLSARIALELAGRRGISPDEAFVAGLLHDFGAIIVLAGLEDLKVELPVLPAKTWKILVDRLHVKFGSVVAKRWNLPPAIYQAIIAHHDVANYVGPHGALVELMATVDQINAIFERAPTAGPSALCEVERLSEDERERVGAMIPQIAEFMASFEAGASAAAEARAPSAVVKPASILDDGWPVEFDVATKRETFRSCAIAPNTLAFRGATALMPNWLAQLDLACDPKLDMLANIKTCEPHPEGGYLLTAQPFGLDGADKQIWFNLIQRTRAAQG
ncbi:MAG: HDOD domain-containing protein [Myxococcales bacterium]|nr:HDOD domain-containing protein [Myxococcales bacterium]